MFLSGNWKDYELLDCSDGERLERWGRYILVRPDPQVIWKGEKSASGWKNPDAVYRRSSSGGGAWGKNSLPDKWTVCYGDLRFLIRPMGFKHTGLFPEQAVNWDWMRDILRKRPGASVLNLFAYTGGATVAAASAGASVCHVDASKGMVGAAKENAELSGLADAPVRYIVDDCRKFVEREIRRGRKFDGIIMDPPSYGRGPSGEVWKIEDEVDSLIERASLLLSDDPLFFLVNSYTTGLSPSTMAYLLEIRVKKRFGGSVEASELALPCTATGAALPAGAAARWQA